MIFLPLYALLTSISIIFTLTSGLVPFGLSIYQRMFTLSSTLSSLNIPSVWNHVSSVLEWDDLFEESLLSIDLSPLVQLIHLSLGEFMEFPTFPSTPVHCIERDVNDWAHHTLTKVFISLISPTHILTPLTLKG